MIKRIILFLSILSFAGIAQAGKKDDIVAAVNKTCGKSITKADVPTAIIRDVFVTCSGGQKINVNGCDIPCLKGNAGAVIGGS